MESSFSLALKVNSDVWQLIFDQLAGDYDSLCCISLVCRTWHILSEPSLFKIVDISSHNNGRLPEHEHSSIFPVAYADHKAEWRPRNLVTRQRALLKTISARPALAKYVKTFVWTFIWLDWNERSITEVDRQTWRIFSLMDNVTRLDLGSLHEAGDEPYVRQNPAELFPKVTHLRLMRWMQRGLVKAIVTSLNTKKLRSLELDYLEDDGAIPDGYPMSFDLALEFARSVKNQYGPNTVDDGLFRRQEMGQASIFPGPMWYPLKLLSDHSLESLTNLQIKLSKFDVELDLRNYYTLFKETAKLLLKAKDMLSTLTIVFGEDRDHYEETAYRSTCGTSRAYFISTRRPWSIKVATGFLNEVLAVLNNNPFPRLVSVVFEGFHFLKHVQSHEAARVGLDATFHAMVECPIANASSLMFRA